jgi:hypothetical protein
MRYSMASDMTPGIDLEEKKSSIITTDREDTTLDLILNEDEMKGIFNTFDENVNAGTEIKISRISIMQPGSPEIANSVCGYEAGSLIDNFSREVLTTKLASPWLDGKVDVSERPKVHTCLIIPAFKLPTEFIKWKNLKTEGRGWHFKTCDRNDARVKEGIWKNAGGTWGTKEGQTGAPPVTENSNYLCLIIKKIDDGFKCINGGIIVTFCKTSFNAGKKLTTFIRQGFQDGIPPFGNVFYLYTIKESDPDSNSTFYRMDIAKCGLTKNIIPSCLKTGYNWHKLFSENKDLQYNYLSAAEIDDGTLSSHTTDNENESSDQDTDPF